MKLAIFKTFLYTHTYSYALTFITEALCLAADFLTYLQDAPPLSYGMACMADIYLCSYGNFIAMTHLVTKAMPIYNILITSAI